MGDCFPLATTNKHYLTVKDKGVLAFVILMNTNGFLASNIMHLMKLYKYSKSIVTKFSNKECLCMHPYVMYFVGISIFNFLAMYIITSF